MEISHKHQQGLLLSILTEKCPHCGKAHVFKKSAGIFKMPEMEANCLSCNYSFDREPGYFLGAMYISYGIAVFFCLLTFLAMHFLLPGLSLVWTPIAMIAVMLLIAKKNYRLSRIIYIHLFPW